MVSAFLKNPSRMFWILHLGGWLAWALFAKYTYTVVTLDEVPPSYFGYVMTISMIGMLLTLVLRYLFKALWARSPWLQAAVFLTGTLAAGYGWLYARSYLYMHYIASREDMSSWVEELGPAAEIYEKVSYISTFIVSWFVILAWASLYFAIKYYQVFQQVQKSALKSAAMAHEAQLKMLRYQLNPHFLFNTLNAISTLILEQATDDANRMVTRLSSFLRHSLDNDPMKRVTLEQELTALGLYLDIEKVRFEDRLVLERDIEAEAYRALIPSLLLQPLVENAIKYGIARSEEGGTLRIAARVFAGDLLLELSDDGPGAQLVDGEIPGANGVGLRNTRERLAELYGVHHSFRLSATEPHGLTIRIRIPFESRSNKA
ncbi:MAG: histidine kinase [Xanthomonadales bacterium]|nr:histidine kinase [Gammaproteobacteria bacterium]NNL04953.1 histidine kinase [Xanthomonadales bacterium]